MPDPQTQTSDMRQKRHMTLVLPLSSARLSKLWNSLNKFLRWRFI